LVRRPVRNTKAGAAALTCTAGLKPSGFRGKTTGPAF
jgi:hypothetical protein